MNASNSGHRVQKIQIFRPTWEEFQDFNKYIVYLESVGAHKSGICKIIPPKEWVPRANGYDDIDITIPSPIQQVVHGKQGMYTQYNVQKKPMHVKEFEQLANSEKYRPPRHTDYDDLERKYWKNVSFINPIYGADVSGSITDDTQKHWNIQRLGSILDCLNDDYGMTIEGVNTAYLYFGMWKTTFAWHTEDMDLYSINYVHYGAAKRWYAIPPEHGRRLERMAAGFFPEAYEQCPAFLRHKMTLISPSLLKKYSIPFDTITQDAGEIIVTFPYGYHSGFNQGFNCAESTNFGSLRWIEYGKRCLQCHCRKDSVKIDMGAFVKRFQPQLYDLWKSGLDVAPHPEEDIAHRKDIRKLTMDMVKKISTPIKRQAYPVEKEASLIMEKSRKTGDSVEEQAPVDQGSGDFCNNAEAVGNDTPSEDAHADHTKLPVVASNDETLASSNILSKHSTNKTKVMCGDAEFSVNEDTDCGSDAESLLLVNLKWALSLTKLWRFNPPNFTAEKTFNERHSKKYPFCSVCNVINTTETKQARVKWPKHEHKTPPAVSLTLLPQSSFLNHGNSEYYSKTMPGKVRPLLLCQNCGVCVHDTCYGVKMLPEGPDKWRCSRCTGKNPERVECCLCTLRGGAIKPTADGRWAHIICAVANKEYVFGNPSSKEPILLNNVDPKRSTLKCIYCGKHSYGSEERRDRYGQCVQCYVNECSKAFHLTCARLADLNIETSDLPFKVAITCQKHQQLREQEKKRPLISLNDKVVVKRNSAYQTGVVTKIHQGKLYCVAFEDDSSSQDLRPSDILHHNPNDGPPPRGTEVQVKWDDDKEYKGYFAGIRTTNFYVVTFKDESTTEVERSGMYLATEPLPLAVIKQLQMDVSNSASSQV